MKEGKFEKPKIEITEQEQLDFANKLEKVGFWGALRLIKEDLVPLAKEKNISLIDAAYLYADQDEEQDTSWFQLDRALRKIEDPNFVD